MKKSSIILSIFFSIPAMATFQQLSDENFGKGHSVCYTDEEMRILAETGDSFSQFSLATILQEKGDIEGAKKWYTKAAEIKDKKLKCSHINSMYSLATILQEEGDSVGAKEWYAKAALQGHKQSKRMLLSLTGM